MNEDIQIRPAQPADAERAAILLYSAYNHIQMMYPPQEDLSNTFIRHLEHFFREDGNRFSYQYIQVAEQRSAVVGLILSFGGRDEAQLNATIGSWLEHEAHDDEWYVDALAVFRDAGHQGIGTHLLQAAEQQARQQHYPKIALNVALGNKEALSLYQHQHYVVTQETFLYQRQYVRMVKTLEKVEQMIQSPSDC
jgi:ribosomal protein S18 acetylase RimI-like enzyme